MITRCPHCQTRFRVRDEQLRAAAGQVRCSRCDNLFNALEWLQEEMADEPVAQPEPERAWPDDDGISLAGLLDDLDRMIERPTTEQMAAEIEIEVDPGELSRIDRLLEEEIGPKEIGSPVDEGSASAPQAPEPDDGEPVVAAEADSPPEAGGDDALDLPGDPPEPLVIPRPAEEIIGEPAAPPRRRTLLWSLLSLLLLVTLAAQWGWWERERLLAHPQGRQLLQRLCALVDCQLPVRRAPGRFAVINREVATHPRDSQALAVRLVFVNRADFAQPYPDLLLSLYNSNQVLIARRRFRPAEYLPPATDSAGLVEAGERVSVEMALADPGREVTGFKFEFM